MGGITYLKQDVTTVTNGIIAHGVNCQGVMGSGVARALRDKWPAIYPPYQQLCARAETDVELLGRVQYVTPRRSDVSIANCFTQVHYGRDGRRYADPEAIEKCLTQVAQSCNQLKLSLYMPKIGCGLGGLSWETEIEPMLQTISITYPDLEIYICDL